MFTDGLSVSACIRNIATIACGVHMVCVKKATAVFRSVALARLSLAWRYAEVKTVKN